MGLTYQAWNNDDLFFDVNFSGAEVLGRVFNLAGIDTGMPDRIPYQSDVEDVKNWVEKLKQMDKTLLAEIPTHLYVGTLDDLERYIEEFIDFLNKCQGYQAI